MKNVTMFLFPSFSLRLAVFSLSLYISLLVFQYVSFNLILQYLFVSHLQQPSSSVPSLSASVAQQAVKLLGREDRKREGGKLKDKMKGKMGRYIDKGEIF